MLWDVCEINVEVWNGLFLKKCIKATVHVHSFGRHSSAIAWLNGRASVFGTEGCGFEPRRGYRYFLPLTQI